MKADAAMHHILLNEHTNRCHYLMSLCCEQENLLIEQSWYLNGRHYSLTLEAWLRRMDAHRREIMPIMNVRVILP